MTVLNPIADLCHFISVKDRLKTLSILEKGFNLNQTVPWNSKTERIEEQVTQSIQEGTEPDVYEALPLNLAIIKGNVDIVSDLLNAGANPLLKDGRNR